jgi:hypothetical protein
MVFQEELDMMEGARVRGYCGITEISHPNPCREGN